MLKRSEGLGKNERKKDRERERATERVLHVAFVFIGEP